MQNLFFGGPIPLRTAKLLLRPVIWRAKYNVRLVIGTAPHYKPKLIIPFNFGLLLDKNPCLMVFLSFWQENRFESDFTRVLGHFASSRWKIFLRLIIFPAFKWKVPPLGFASFQNFPFSGWKYSSAQKNFPSLAGKVPRTL